MGMLEGRVAIVTGAGRGIGASVARALAQQGAAVVVNDPGVALDGSGADAGPADEVVRAIREAGGQAAANYNSVADHDQTENIIRTAIDSFGRMDILVNVAGILRDRMIFNMSEEDWDAVLNVHLKGTFNTTKFASIYWRAQREGDYRLINFTSEAGIHGAAGQPNYAAAKAGTIGFTYSCANALGRYGVTANCISPRASTRMTTSMGGRAPNVDHDAPDRSPDNVAVPVVYLASKRSSWLTGRVILVRGFHIALFNTPQVVTDLVSPGPWDLETAAQEMESAFRELVQGPAARSTPAPAVAPAAGG